MIKFKKDPVSLNLLRDFCLDVWESQDTQHMGSISRSVFVSSTLRSPDQSGAWPFSPKSTMESAVKRVPVEIWRKILYQATMSPFLPFTEEGKLSSDLMKSVDLFSMQCQDLRPANSQLRTSNLTISLPRKLWIRPK
ncbi:9805_t:CDS:2, partial [Acaulospora colombiana]